MRFLARGFSNPGDHTGQASHGYRWPYGPVTLITPFNFPLEIPVLQVGLTFQLFPFVPSPVVGRAATPCSKLQSAALGRLPSVAVAAHPAAGWRSTTSAALSTECR